MTVQITNPPLKIQEVDGSPSGNPVILKVTNGTLTDNGNGTFSVTTGGGGGSSADIYTPTNVTTTRSYNATSTSLNELASVLGSLIASLQGAGIIH